MMSAGGDGSGDIAMGYETIRTMVDGRGVAWLTLSRPQLRNAMNGRMYDEARSAFEAFEKDDGVRAVVLSGDGEMFCSGGDLQYLKEQSALPHDERVAEVRKLAYWLREIDTCSKPVIGRINGSAYAGGLGLISACDVAIGVADAKFAITEARLGLLPSLISPYVVRRIGVQNARRYFLTGRIFSGEQAVGLGLLDAAVPPEDLDEAVEAELHLILNGAPRALKGMKALIEYVSTHGAVDNFTYTTDRVVDVWGWPEAAEGLDSFLQKRKPAWRL